jgi:GR25 family glycosyltransferase involved in LPS biosynthesis
MKSLFYSYDNTIESAYIITVKGDPTSEKYSLRCQQSCKEVGMPFKVWDAFDGLGKNINVPHHSKDDSIIKILKVTNHYLTRGEIACALSHISLWRHCAEIDKPIVILEHDSVMVKKIEHLNSFNSITYLGGVEWFDRGWKIYPIPPHASEGHNYHFICRAHAYAIDPTIAKNLLSYVIKNGIIASLDMMMRADLFNISHNGLYAYDNGNPEETTIKERAKEGRATIRNDHLNI